MPSYSASDLTYVLGEYRTMPELCDAREWSSEQVDALVEAGRLPAATYVLPSGERRYPPDYFAVADEVGLDGVEARFRERFLAAGGPPADCDDFWSSYLSGQMGVCLRVVTPEMMVTKVALIARVEELTGAAEPDDPTWRDALRTAVTELDGVLRPFTDFDRERWGDTSRDRVVTRVKEKWAVAFDTST